MNQTPDPIDAGLRAWAEGDLDALEILLAPEVSLRAVQPGPCDCTRKGQVMALLAAAGPRGRPTRCMCAPWTSTSGR